MERSKVYYAEDGGGLFLNVGCMSVLSPKQVCDRKLPPFWLTICIVWFIYCVCDSWTVLKSNMNGNQPIFMGGIR
jgi:hypothetical protein